MKRRIFCMRNWENVGHCVSWWLNRTFIYAAMQTCGFLICRSERIRFKVYHGRGISRGAWLLQPWVIKMCTLALLGFKTHSALTAGAALEPGSRSVNAKVYAQPRRCEKYCYAKLQAITFTNLLCVCQLGELFIFGSTVFSFPRFSSLFPG